MNGIDFNYFLNRKYAQLDTQAKATQMNAQANLQNAATNRMVGKAGANLDQTKANLLPAESREALLKSASERGLINEQASVVRPTADAQIGLTRAQTGLVGEQINTERRGNMAISEILGDAGVSRLTNILTGVGGGSMIRTSDISPARRDSARARRGLGSNPSAADLDFVNGF